MRYATRKKQNWVEDLKLVNVKTQRIETHQLPNNSSICLFVVSLPDVGEEQCQTSLLKCNSGIVIGRVGGYIDNGVDV